MVYWRLKGFHGVEGAFIDSQNNRVETNYSQSQQIGCTKVFTAFCTSNCDEYVVSYPLMGRLVDFDKVSEVFGVL